MWRTAETPRFNSEYTVSVDGRKFDVRVPVTEAEKNRGYREVAAIPENECMLFMYAYPRPMTFTMQNCLVGLRIVFCDKDYRVLQVSDAAAGVPEVPCNNPLCQNVIEFGLERNPPNVKAGERVVVVITPKSKQDFYNMPAFFRSVFDLN